MHAEESNLFSGNCAKHIHLTLSSTPLSTTWNKISHLKLVLPKLLCQNHQSNHQSGSNSFLSTKILSIIYSIKKRVWCNFCGLDLKLVQNSKRNQIKKVASRTNYYIKIWYLDYICALLNTQYSIVPLQLAYICMKLLLQ